jgi:hypothetical protein
MTPASGDDGSEHVEQLGSGAGAHEPTLLAPALQMFAMQL